MDKKEKLKVILGYSRRTAAEEENHESESHSA